MKRINKIIGVIMLLFAVGFNLWIYRLEPTAQVDPNDNLFQFALVYRTNQMWDFASKTCSSHHLSFVICHLSFLIDHWVPNWNEGYNLPFYYSHVPQIAIVGSYRLFHGISQFLISNFKLLIKISNFKFQIGLFQYYHLIIYLLLCFFPLSVFLALLITGLSPVTAGFGALLATQISTDGFYGLDPSSFLWRGYGLSSQLFAMVWLPLAIAYAWRYFATGYWLLATREKTKLLPFLNFLSPITNNESLITRDLLLAILFLALTTSGHIGVGIMAFLSLIPLAAAEPVMAFIKRKWERNVWDRAKINIVKLIVISAVTIFLLSYWLIPAYLGDNFHNFSFWDPVWKFNSYGAKEVLARLGNGALFDFGRLPIITGLIIIGIFAVLSNETSGLASLALLFIFWLLLYFGRTTWGNLINLIPSMKEFHLSRFIVGVHAAGLFLAPIGLTWIAQRINVTIQQYNHKTIRYSGLLYSSIALLLSIGTILLVYPQTIRYNDLNNTLILQANGNYAKQSQDMNLLVSTIQNLQSTSPGRVFAGRGGSWGKDFKIAETEMTMYLGNFALPTVLWLPETWSPNGDTEQYFREDKAQDYDLFNIRYVATPINLAKESIQPFWKPIKEGKSWRLYSVDVSSLGNVSNLSGYFTAGVRPAIVAADKYSRANVVRLWIQSDDSKNGLYPELSFDTKNYPVNTGLPNFKMLDDVTFQVPDGSTHNIFSSVPKYVSPLSNLSTLSHLKITDQKDNADMVFSARVSVSSGCTECLVILKQTYDPNWRVTDNGSPVTPLIVFPFYIGIPVSEGNHMIVASYEPAQLKVFLLIVEIVVALSFVVVFLKKRSGKSN